MRDNSYSNKIVSFTSSPLKHGSKKPKKAEVGRIINSFNPKGILELPIEEFAEKGVSHPWLPYVTSRTVSNDSFVKSNILTLDIDNKKNEGFTVEKFLNDCDKYKLDCSFIYTTFQDETSKENWKNAKRYRAVFFLTEYITNFIHYKNALQSLQNIFKCTDENYKAHMYCNGGKFLCYYDWKSSINLEQLALVGATSITANLKNSSSITRKANNHFQSLGINSKIKYKAPNSPLKEKDLKLLVDECLLLGQFLHKKCKIYHNQLFGLFLFFKKYKGGLKLFKSCIKENPFIDNRKIIEIIGLGNVYLKYNNEQATKEFLDKNDPALKYPKLSAILSTKKSKAITKKPIDLLSIKEIETVLKNSFKKLETNKQSVLQFPVGIGKTKEIVDMPSLKKTVIAVPNKKLLDEIEFRLICAGHKPAKLIACETDRLPEKNLEYYKKLLDIGLGGKAVGYLRSLVKNPDKIESESESDNKEIAFYLQNYFQEHDELLLTEEPIITTHAKLLTTKFENHDKIIVDEDILLSCLSTKEIAVKDIETLYKCLKNSSNNGLSKIVENIILNIAMAENYDCFKISGNKIATSHQKTLIRKIIVQNRNLFKSPIGFLLKTKAYTVLIDKENNYKKIQCIQKQKYPHSSKNSLFLSATMNKFISSKILPKSSHISMTNAQHTSKKMYQISDKSFSRGQMKKETYKEHIDLICQRSLNESIITFKSPKIRELFDEDKLSNLCLGNCEGSDKLKGRKISVIGTPNFPHYTYILYALALGIKFSQKDTKWENCKITDERGTYTITTFKHEELRKLHFYFLDSLIIQAIGRCRSLREENAEVYYFGSFPVSSLKQLSFREYKELDF